MHEKKELNVNINTTIPLSTAQALDAFAKENDISIQDALRAVLAKALSTKK